MRLSAEYSTSSLLVPAGSVTRGCGRDRQADAVRDYSFDADLVRRFLAAKLRGIDDRQAAARHEPQPAIVGPDGPAVVAVDERQPRQPVGAVVPTERRAVRRIREQPFPFVASDLKDARARSDPQRAFPVVDDGGDVRDRKTAIAPGRDKASVETCQPLRAAEPDDVIAILEDCLVDAAIDAVGFSVDVKVVVRARGDLAVGKGEPRATAAVGHRRLDAGARQRLRKIEGVEPAVVPVQKSAFGVEDPCAVVAVGGDVVDQLWHRRTLADRQRREAVTAQPRDAVVGRHPQRAGPVGVEGPQPGAVQRMAFWRHAVASERHFEQFINRADPKRTGPGALDAGHQADVRDLRDLVGREPMNAFRSACPDVAFAIFYDGDHAVGEQTGQCGRTFGEQHAMLVEPDAPESLTRGANPDVVAAVAHQRPPAAALEAVDRLGDRKRAAKSVLLIADEQAPNGSSPIARGSSCIEAISVEPARPDRTAASSVLAVTSSRRSRVR